MGIPKFYRWISERYPNISRTITDNQIPNFDNFYLDMNGIIHACSHTNDDKSDTMATEEEIFRNIFHYIDFLFRMVMPRKVFFMAVDGVAPRAKMNQQRSRRFRAGRDRVRKLKEIARYSGQSLSSIMEKSFDTNAITPGTPFMARLDEQLKYFIHVKLTTDPLWKNVEVHLSGHLTPGEGEHKIMEYIRYVRSQPGYDVNTRHCLYGLDADLIMLSLVTHEMHFALLREEVKFNSKKALKLPQPEDISWQIFHTCILRDYIDLEFRSIRDQLKFPYELDSIVDDWILMGYLVGNDFVPHLPHFHINKEALTTLWDTYKRVLPTLDGYMNECGELNLARFQIYVTELAKFDNERFASENDAFKHLEKLHQRKKDAVAKAKTPKNADGFDFDLSVLDKLKIDATSATEEALSSDVLLTPVQGTVASNIVDLFLSDDDDNEGDHDTSSQSDVGNHRSDDEKPLEGVSFADEMDRLPLIEAEFRQHKNHYYRDKMKINVASSNELKVYVEQYIEALQWILKYYYQGCPSWSWFYPQHYAPYLSDLQDFKDLKFDFHRGKPFKPFEQLLGVLPPSSCSLLPSALQPIMTSLDSPMLYLYPEDFCLDQNEKKADWESIVLLPFIDEALLLNTIEKYYNQLSISERNLNQHLPSLCFKATSKANPIGNSLARNPYFPALTETCAVERQYPVDHYQLESHQIKYGCFKESDRVFFPRFPVLNVLPYKYDYKTKAVTIFEIPSTAVTLILSSTYKPDSDCIQYNSEWNQKDESSVPPFQITDHKLLIERYLGKRVFVNWPNFEEGIVCAISDFKNIYAWNSIPGGLNFVSPIINHQVRLDYKSYSQTPADISNYPFEISDDNKNRPVTWTIFPLDETQIQMEYQKALSINAHFEKRKGIAIGPIPVLLYVSKLIGCRTKCLSKTGQLQTMMCFSNQVFSYPLQTTLFNIPKYRSHFKQFPKNIYDYFKIDEPIFSLQNPYYSSMGFVKQIRQDANGKYLVSCQIKMNDALNHPDIFQESEKFLEHQYQYFTAYDVAVKLKTPAIVISKITGKVTVRPSDNRNRQAYATNIGLSWKYNSPTKQLHGYTQKYGDTWYYSEAAIPIIEAYISKFPEIITEIKNKPNKDSYLESHIWPSKNAKHELQQVRIWIKSLPTYTMTLTGVNFEMLDPPVVDEIGKFVQSFHAKRATKNLTQKTKIADLQPHCLYKPDVSVGLCDPDNTTEFYIFDRVVSVRPDAGVPIGTQGTIIGIIHGRTYLDTYYEILFDNLPPNSLGTITMNKNEVWQRVQLRSYHLMNYTHSLRLRSRNYIRSHSFPKVDLHSTHQYAQVTEPRTQEKKQPRQEDSYHGNKFTKQWSVQATPTQEYSSNSQVIEQNSNVDSSRSNASTAQQMQSTFLIGNTMPIQSTVNDSFGQTAAFMTQNSFESSNTFPYSATTTPLLHHAIRDAPQLPGSYQQSFNMSPSTPIHDPNSSFYFHQQPCNWMPYHHGQQLPMNQGYTDMPTLQEPTRMLQPQLSPYMQPPSPHQLPHPVFPIASEPIGPFRYNLGSYLTHEPMLPPQQHNLPLHGTYYGYSPQYEVNMTNTHHLRQIAMQMQNPATALNQSHQNPYSSYEPKPPPAQHMGSAPQAKVTQFVPSQVLRNIPKSHKFKEKMTSSTTTTTNALIDSQLDCALDLMRRLPPQQVEKNLSDLVDLVPDLTEELLAAVDQPLKVVRDRTVGKDYLLCDYNRDGDSYRSPWTNTYMPPFDGNLPSDRLRHLEIDANQAFEQYREMYFEGGVSSVYFWDLENGFAGVVLIKKVGDGSKKIKGCWDSIHVIEVQEKQGGRTAHYKLTSTVMLWLQTQKTMSGMMNLGGSLTRQLESDHQITDFSQHIINIGKMVEEMENKIRQTLNAIYFGKTKDILNSLRNSESAQNRIRLQQANFTGELQSALSRTRPSE